MSTNLSDSTGAAINRILTDNSGNVIYARCATGSIPAGGTAGYAVGCILTDSTAGTQYTNKGTAASSNFLGISS